MQETKINRMRRATAKRAANAKQRATDRVANSSNAYARTPLGKAEERLIKKTGRNTVMGTYDRYYDDRGRRKKRR